MELKSKKLNNVSEKTALIRKKTLSDSLNSSFAVKITMNVLYIILTVIQTNKKIRKIYYSTKIHIVWPFIWSSSRM